jgi:hypothetical protein
VSTAEASTTEIVETPVEAAPPVAVVSGAVLDVVPDVAPEPAAKYVRPELKQVISPPSTEEGAKAASRLRQTEVADDVSRSPNVEKPASGALPPEESRDLSPMFAERLPSPTVDGVPEPNVKYVWPLEFILSLSSMYTDLPPSMSEMKEILSSDANAVCFFSLLLTFVFVVFTYRFVPFIFLIFF